MRNESDVALIPKSKNSKGARQQVLARKAVTKEVTISAKKDFSEF
ncbi:hypothetical protein MNB_SV-8-1065 [hydrothermal vent metagenome]|uniref:Uncharacterized protein n=1 Tax=hydrothermal vent metagenome TaxID=652676 RepID=A0A1W1BUJ1_9ZZZZ